jgi:hypothetical protein
MTRLNKMRALIDRIETAQTRCDADDWQDAATDLGALVVDEMDDAHDFGTNAAANHADANMHKDEW